MKATQENKHVSHTRKTLHKKTRMEVERNESYWWRSHLISKKTRELVGCTDSVLVYTSILKTFNRHSVVERTKFSKVPILDKMGVSKMSLKPSKKWKTRNWKHHRNLQLRCIFHVLKGFLCTISGFFFTDLSPGPKSKDLVFLSFCIFELSFWKILLSFWKICSVFGKILLSFQKKITWFLENYADFYECLTI